MTQPKREQALEKLFESWLSGEPLSEAAMTQLTQHPEWSARMQMTQQLNQMVEESESEVKVPNWNMDAGFDQYLAKPSWWQRQGMATVALCFSIFACFIMLFDVKLVQNEQGMQLVWSDQQNQQALDAQFAALASSNRAQIDERMDALEQKHLDNTAQLVTYVLENSRLERKEDIEAVVQMIQQQRTDDLDYLKQQFEDISYSIRLASRRNQRLAIESQDPETQLTEE